MKKLAVITGASAGIGEAIARRLAANGWDLFLGARRIERLEKIAGELGAACAFLDVADSNSVEAFCKLLPDNVELLVNNAGGALGLEPVREARDEDWLQMYQSNVLGVMRMTRSLIARLIHSKGHIVNVTSIAGREVYPNGAGYTGVKHAARALTQTLRMELNGEPVRITDIAPGLVDTEFSTVRFAGDKARADAVYEGITALTADDIAECIAWCVELPWHINIDELVVKPLAQAGARQVARGVGL